MRGDEAYLLDMLLAARDAEEFASESTFAKFECDRLRQHALIKAIEIIGEAASRVSARTQDLNPEIPWREIVGMRNRLVHAYFEVDVELLWETVQRDIPKLIALLEPSAPPEEA